ncbi:MAG TPA: PQQ-binding-like beta-propeller repeat protein [Candidatus Sulfotelmatobacter sp.]|nr:PQQ-binding-like beta-propeller repeat protein [Candidatus Sulfotelmatobacter sp.]
MSEFWCKSAVIGKNTINRIRLGIRVKSLLIALMIALVLSGFLMASVTHLGLTQDSTKYTISGYILDADGRGIQGANIILNVPEIVPSVWSDSSGYYVMYVPIGTYHLNVWPPYNSKFIHYDEPGFVVKSDVVKNITLYLGYKVSGYISTFDGTPITGAAILLRTSTNNWFGSGWFSNSNGYYFLNLPSGTYTIDAHPRTGYDYLGPTSDFKTYYEFNFTVKSDTIKNITVDASSSIPMTIPNPIPEPSSWGNCTSNPNSWPMFHNDLTHSGYSKSTGPLTNQILWKYQTGSGVESSPAIVDGIVYVGALWNGKNGFVYALNASTGSKIWSFATNSGIESSPAVVNGIVYIGSYLGRVYALNAFSGSVIWSFNTGKSVFSSPAAVDNVVYVGSADGYMYALNASSGSQLWSYYTNGEIISSPAVVDGVVYFGSEDHNLYALRADDGTPIWQFTPGGLIETSPTVIDGRVCFTSSDGYAYALDASNGSKIWSFCPQNSGGNRYYSSPSIANGLVYVGSYDNSIYALNVTNGSLFWKFRTDNYIFSSPIVDGRTVYVGSFDNNLYALDAMNGSKIWSYQTGDMMRSSAAVADGIVYVGSGDGYLYAFGSASAPSTLSTSTLSSTGPSVSTNSKLIQTLAETNSSSDVTWVTSDNVLDHTPIQQTLSTEAEPQDLDVSYWTWIAVAAIVALPIVSFIMLLKGDRKT